MRILIVDDDAVSRIVLEMTLRKLGHDVLSVDQGRQAWEVLQRERFPLVISDWLMPDLDGLELSRRIRGMGGGYTYLILLTSLGGRDKCLEAMEAGVDDFVSKPFDEEQLVARIRVAERILGLLAEVRTLTGMLPICCYCKKIRDDHDFWQQVEVYVMEHSEATFSHGICPHCYEERVLPELRAAGLEPRSAPGPQLAGGEA